MITVIIAIDNAANTLEHCLQSLRQQSITNQSIEIIVVDKNSSDKTLAIARESADQIIQNDGKNSAQARNMALGQARGDIICFTNGDCIPESGWHEEFTKPLSDSQIVGSKGTYTTKQKNVTSRFIQLEFEEKYRRLQKDDHIDFIDGYSAAYRREVLEANKGFDKRFDMLEDQELSYRLVSRGYRMVFAQDALVDHHHFTRFFLYLRSKNQMAHWTSHVVRKFPDRAYRDSYTPQILKVQIFLIALLLFSLVLAPWSLNALLLSSLIFASFLLTTLPFLIRTWPSDPTVALLAPIFVAGRACALGMGYVVGAIRFTTIGGHEKSTITGLSYLIKRAMDLVGSIFGMALLIVLFPVIGLMIKATSPGPLIYKQERIGRGGQSFTMYRFRSMIAEADQVPRGSGIDGEVANKLIDDPRITPVGAFLRRWSLDEIPQFINVLSGEMSLVGPRPEESYLVERYSSTRSAPACGQARHKRSDASKRPHGFVA